MIICINVVFTNYCRSKITWSYNFPQTFVFEYFKMFCLHSLTNNEFVTVKYKKTVLLHVRMWMKQQRENFEFLRVSKGSCTESVNIYVLQLEEWNSLLIEKEYHIVGLMHQNIHIVYSKLNESILLFYTIFNSVHTKWFRNHRCPILLPLSYWQKCV